MSATLVTTPLLSSMTDRGTPGCGMTGHFHSHHYKLNSILERTTEAWRWARRLKQLYCWANMTLTSLKLWRTSALQGSRWGRWSWQAAPWGSSPAETASVSPWTSGARGWVPGDSCSGVIRPPTVWINQMKRIVSLFTWRYENKFSAFLKSFRETTTRKFLLFNLTKSKRKLFQSISM